MSGRFTQAEALLDESAQVFDDLGDPYMQAYRQSLRGIFFVLLGQWEHADTQVQMGLRLCREAGFSTGVGVSLWTLCWLVLARGQRGLDAGLPPGLPEGGEARKAATEARRMAERSITLLREMRHRADLAVALAALSMAERWLGNREQAQQHMGEALRISAPTGSLEAVLFALPGTALLLADRGDREQAVEVYALASRYPFVANSAWFELMFGRHIAAVAGSLPAEVVTAAEARGRDRDLWATVEELVAELR